MVYIPHALSLFSYSEDRNVYITRMKQYDPPIAPVREKAIRDRLAGETIQFLAKLHTLITAKEIEDHRDHLLRGCNAESEKRIVYESELYLTANTRLHHLVNFEKWKRENARIQKLREFNDYVQNQKGTI